MSDKKTYLKDHENESLTLEDLNIEELERRLELAATDAACTCSKFA